jgi:hypothetical protein
MIEVTQVSNGSLDISWDPNDPKEQVLNNLIAQDFVDLIQTKLESIAPTDPTDTYLYMISYDYETGGGRTTCIMMTQALPSCAEGYAETTQKERAIRKFREKFGDYYADSVNFVTRHHFCSDYSYFLPVALLDIKNSNGAIEFYMELHYNNA